jgi:hypothetical protein
MCKYHDTLESAEAKKSHLANNQLASQCSYSTVVSLYFDIPIQLVPKFSLCLLDYMSVRLSEVCHNAT